MDSSTPHDPQEASSRDVPILDDSSFTQEFATWWRGATAGTSASPRPASGPVSHHDRAAEGARDVVREVHPGVFAVRLLTPAACRELLRAIDERHELAMSLGASSPPNSMHDHGFVLDGHGFTPLLADLRERWLAPLTSARFSAFGGAHLDTHHGYVVDYAKDRDEELGFHADDSEVTVNLCLGDAFRGAELTMMGLRCDLHRQTPVRPDEIFEIVHEPGTAIVHAGRHRHRVEPIRGGRRRNLILWCRDSTRRTPFEAAARAASCAPWCRHRP